MSLSILDYLSHIHDETLYVTEQLPTTSPDEFLRDDTLKRAFVRSIEIIGEATKHIPATFREKYEQVAWKSMAGMRDVLIHNYLGVNYRLVWEVVSERIPELKVQIEQILEQERFEAQKAPLVCDEDIGRDMGNGKVK